ncbi:accessory gland protein Acp29AB [Drosophila gunungcola]|uniref:C-type lectin domain-containing protein n=1 Tax=Drosophila gunungcola TaxID=103775 RepID=A0A9P9YU18_9MUSC|nr:accessory gland protein Acp29AB [Drosophila gunungcola]KAI8043081.1 hypothetical protein M5D96_004407 [Drosophila gunungcola]
MPKSTNVFFYVFVAMVLNVSLAILKESGRNVCLLQDPPNQCGEFCLSALMPLIDHIAKHQDQWKTCDNVKLNETQAKLDRIEGQQTAIKVQIEKQETSLKESWKKIISENFQASREKMEVQLQARQMKMEGKLSAIQETLTSIKMSLETLKLNTKKTIPCKFEQIGSRYFYIEDNQKQNWTSAITTCNQMGGQLATIQNEREFNAISGKLLPDFSYMLGISDLAKKGVFISESSGKSAPFLKWKPGEPDYAHPDQRCVAMHNGGMWVDGCTAFHNFICQAED